MEKTKEKYVFSGLALMSGFVYLGVPGILLMSDYKQGGMTQALEAIEAAEYDEIRLWAFYVPIIALFLFAVFAGTILQRGKLSIAIGVLCTAFSIWSLFEISTIGLFGLLVSVGYLYNVYAGSK